MYIAELTGPNLAARETIPIRVELTVAELEVNDTNKLWHTASRAGRTPEPVNVEILP